MRDLLKKQAQFANYFVDNKDTGRKTRGLFKFYTHKTYSKKKKKRNIQQDLEVNGKKLPNLETELKTPNAYRGTVDMRMTKITKSFTFNKRAGIAQPVQCPVTERTTEIHS